MNNSKKLFRIFIYIFLITVSIFSILYIVKYSYDIYNAKKQSNLLDEIEIEKNTTIANDIVVDEKEERISKLKELQKTNSDIKGWLQIENTNINYPVLQSSDNSFYMNHNYKKDYSLSGSIFLDKDYSWEIPSSNLLIYGHNMKNDTMFRDLLNYKDQSYYIEHPNIRFTTNTEDCTFEIISVFNSKVYYASEQNVFRYYYFINAQNENQFNDFINNSKKASIYNIDKTAIYGDQLMTLSTCSYNVKDGRFVVVAKKNKQSCI